MHQQPNVLLVIVDQMRRDALGLNNPSGPPHTPHLDVLARESVNFTRAYSACPSCIAARASLMTGLRHERHGFTGYDAAPQWRYPATLAGTFAAAGYHTQCVGKMHVQPARHLAGFHNVVLHDGFLHDKRHAHHDPLEHDDYLPWLRQRLGPSADIADAGPGCNGYSARVWPWDERFHPSAYVVTKSIEFLKRRDPSKPFFLKTSFHRPHSPLDPPRSYWDMHARTALPDPPTGDWVDFPLGAGHPENPIPSDPLSRDRARRAYHALVSQIDYEFNRLISTLVGLNLWNNTILLFVSDHGDMLYDHHLVRKSTPFEGSAGIPLLLRLPPALRAGLGGTTSTRLAELRDLFPTLCDLCGIPPPDGLDGQNLLSPSFARTHLHGEHPNGELSNQWLTDGLEKYCWFSQSGRELLFDLVADPAECHDLSAQRPDRTAHWRNLLIQELQGRPEGYSDGRTLHTNCHPRGSLPWAGTDNKNWRHATT